MGASPGPSTLRTTCHDWRLIKRCRIGQKLVIYLLLGFGVEGGNSDLLSGMMMTMMMMIYFKSHKSKASEVFFFSFRFSYWVNQVGQANENHCSSLK